MKYYTLLLVLVLAILYGCEQSEKTDTPRQSPYVITSQQDDRNPLKYKFGIDHYGRLLTSSDAVFAWDFGDNDGIVTKSNPTHVYAENGHKKVSVSLLVDGSRVSADTVILAGEPSTVYDSVINAFPGDVSNPLYYSLVSSANGSGLYNYKWEITGPDGENGENITYIYPNEESDYDDTKNLLNHQFKKYGYGYYVNLYIKSQDTDKFSNTPSNTMYFTTVLPEFSMRCSSTGIVSNQKTTINCIPALKVQSGAISDNMEYEWVYYSVNSDGTPVRDGSIKTTGNETAELRLQDGANIVTASGTNSKEMTGEVKYETEIVLSSSGVLNNMGCARPTDNVGNYTDNTRLQYECKAEGYYHKQADLTEPLPITTYLWRIKENNNNNGVCPDINTNNNDQLLSSIEWGGEQDEAQYLNNGYKPSADNTGRVRVDCDNTANKCYSTLLFTAPEYGKSYCVYIDGSLIKEDGNKSTLHTDNNTVTTYKPQMLYIDKQASEQNPMQFTLTPVFDTVIPSDKKLSLKYYAQGSNITNPATSWLEQGLDNVSFDTRSVSHTFSQSGNYVIDVKPTLDSNLEIEKAADYDGSILQIDQNIAGSYFVNSINTFTGQVTFSTDYEVRVNGSPVPTTYVYTITGPTKDNVSAGNVTKLAVTDRTFTTSKYDTNNNSNNIRLLFGGEYKVSLEVYQTSLYNDMNNLEKVNDVSYKKIDLKDNISIPSLNIEFKTKQANGRVSNAWYEDLTFSMSGTDTTANGVARVVAIDRSLFTCEWTFDNNTPESLKFSYNLPVTEQNSSRSLTTDCSKKIYNYAFGTGSGTVTTNLKIQNGPAVSNGALYNYQGTAIYTIY